MKNQFTISQLNKFNNMFLKTLEKNNIDTNKFWHIELSTTHQNIRCYAYYSKELVGHLIKNKFVAKIEEDGTIRLSRSLITIRFIIVS
jgi:hypothetical protein